VNESHTEAGTPRRLRLFTISPRTTDPQQYWQDILNVATWTDRLAWTGTLLFTGNDTYLDPWVVAQAILTRTRHVAPLVAVNPIYIHPFTVAKTIASLSRLYDRKLHLNLVTGTALTHLDSLGDSLSHDERYDRLLEFATIIRQLVTTRRPLSFEGRWYTLRNVRLPLITPPALMPEFVVAGHSPAARRVCSELGATGMHMLTEALIASDQPVRGVHCGVVTRPSDQEAHHAASLTFRESEEGRAVLESSMRNTDSVWKRELHRAAVAGEGTADSGCWLTPFRDFKADCPYLVGGYERVADTLARLVARGADTFIFDIPAVEQEFAHVQSAWQLLERRIHAAQR
jgi:alkanesulfonate monooxygenase